MSEVSAFGVVHKSFKKLNPKLNRLVDNDKVWSGHATMGDRIKGNYAIGRQAAGQEATSVVRRQNGKITVSPDTKPGPEDIAVARSRKKFSQAQVKASGNRGRRKGPERLP